MFYMSGAVNMQSTEDYDKQNAGQLEDDMGVISKKSSLIMFERYATDDWGEYLYSSTVLFINIALPTFVFNVLFSDMTHAGRGLDIIDFLSDHYGIAVVCGGFGFMLLLITYLFDGFKYWRTENLVYRQYFVFSVVGVCIVIGGFFAAQEYAFAPLAIGLILFLGYSYGVRSLLLKEWSTQKFLYYMWRVLAFTAVGLGLWWTVWVFGFDHAWNEETKQEMVDRMDHCEWDEDHDGICLHGFLIWFCPFLLASIEMTFAVIVYFLMIYVTDEVTGNKDLAFRVFITLVALTCMSVWAAASVAGANMELANAIVAFMFSGTVWVGVILVAVIGFKELIERFSNIPLVKKIEHSFLSGWFRALFLMMFFWVILFYTILSVLNQKLREMGCTNKAADFSNTDEKVAQKMKKHASKKEQRTEELEVAASDDLRTDTEYSEFDEFAVTKNSSESTEAGAMISSSEIIVDIEEPSCCDLENRLTKQASRQYVRATYWNWTGIHSKIVIWGIIYLTLIVFTAKFVTVLLAVLGEAIADWSLIVVCLIFMVIGLIMFLLPPVPGVPVYLTGGIIIPSAAEDELGFWGGVALSCVVCCVVKFMAIVMQQKLIGEMLGKKVWVRRFVGVNSLSIRAIEDILRQDGLVLSKVAILVGGPDWPTSVLTGILGLPMGEMLFGSLPILFLIAPTAMAGAMMKKASDGGSWEALAGVTLTLAAFVQGIALLSALHFIEKTVFKKEDELAAKEDDHLVAALDEFGEEKKRLFKSKNDWENLSFWRKMQLSSASVIMICVCCVIQLFGTSCFETFQLTDKLKDPPLDGNVFNLFKPLGWVVTGFFFVSIILWWWFNTWAFSQIKTLPEFVEGQERIKKLIEEEEAQMAGKRTPENSTSQMSGHE